MGDASDVALKYFQALSDSDVNGAIALLADDVDFRSPLGQIPRETVGTFLGAFDAAFPDARFDVDVVIESGPMVAVEGTYRGSHQGPLMTPDGAALAATGRSVAAPFVTVFEIADGRIRSHRPYWDFAGLMRQLTG